jgi:hypothetical protein
MTTATSDRCRSAPLPNNDLVRLHALPVHAGLIPEHLEPIQTEIPPAGFGWCVITMPKVIKRPASPETSTAESENL